MINSSEANTPIKKDDKSFSKALIKDNFPDKYISSIGLVVVQFNLLEVVLRGVLTSLILIDPNVTVRLLSFDKFSVLVSKFEKLIIYLFPKHKDLDYLLDLVKKLYKINEDRNEVIHSFWALDDNGKMVSTKSLRKINRKEEIEKMIYWDIKRLKEFLNRMSDVSSRLLDFEKQVVEFRSKNK